MTHVPVPGPPPALSPVQGQPPAAPSRVWKVLTAIFAVLALVLPMLVFALMDRQSEQLRADLDEARRELVELRADGSGGTLDGLGGLGSLLEGLGGGGLDGGALGGLDPALLQCLTPGLGGLGDLGGLGGLGDLDLGDLEGLEGLLGELDLESLFPSSATAGSPTSSTSAVSLVAALPATVPAGIDGVPEGDLATQIKAIEAIIAAERGVTARDYTIELVTPEEVQRRAVEINRAELEGQRDRLDGLGSVLIALGALPPGTDLLQSQLDALEAGVGGFYDPTTRELVIGSTTLDGLGAFITSHELVHAMTDATLGLPDLTAIARDQGADAAAAALNAVEGDASLYSQRFISERLSFDQLMALQGTSDATMAQMADLPHVVSRSLQMPYIEGLTFTCKVFLDGGWAAVDRTYSQVPTTTAQILFPDRWTASEGAVPVADPPGPAGWQQTYADTFGAADLMVLFEAPGGDVGAGLSDPKGRAAAWAGGSVTGWAEGDRSAVALVLADRGGAVPLCESMEEFVAAQATRAERSGGSTTFTAPGRSAVLRCSGSEVALGVGPDAVTASSAIG